MSGETFLILPLAMVRVGYKFRQLYQNAIEFKGDLLVKDETASPPQKPKKIMALLYITHL